MTTIILTYPILFGWRQKSVQTNMPESWEELKPPQLVALARSMKGEMKEDDLLVEMLELPHSIVAKLDDFQRYKLGECLASLQGNAPFKKFVIPDILGLQPPKPGLQDVSFVEFMHIDTFYMDYIEVHNPEYLLKLVACLYVPYVNYERPKFTDVDTSLVERYINPIQLEAIAMNYGLVRQWLEAAYPEVFPQADETAPDSGRKHKKGNGWVDVFDNLVGDDIPYKETYAYENCTEILRYMNRKIIENRKKRAKA